MATQLRKSFYTALPSFVAKGKTRPKDLVAFAAKYADTADRELAIDIIHRCYGEACGRHEAYQVPLAEALILLNNMKGVRMVINDLIESERYTEAARLLERIGDMKEAIRCYLYGGEVDTAFRLGRR